jgi:hypothetical protein
VTFARHLLISIGTALAALLLAAPAPARAADAVIAFLDAPEGTTKTVYDRLAEREELALGLMSATQGAYTVRQTVLDLSAGNRTSRATYDPDGVPAIRPVGPRVEGWPQVLARAETAFADIRPGLLADRMGGAAFVAREPAVEGVLAADREGRIAEVSYGRDVVDRIRRSSQPLVVAILPGERALDELLRTRPDDELLIVIRRPPRSRAIQMLPVGIAGLSETPSLLRSPTTRRTGLIAATDVLATLVGEDLDGVTGRRITAEPGREVAQLRRLERRLRVVYPRRFPALTAVVLGLLAAGLALRLAGRRSKARRVIGLAALWVPSVSLACAALAPSYTGELVLMAAGSVVLALLTDRLLPWPRGPALPAGVAIVGYTADLIGGSYLTVRSLLGPNPRFGSRFYGIGNELEATLPVLALVGLAALLVALPPGRRLAAAFGATMVAFAAVLGAGRLGADVGGVITTGAAAAAAVLVAYGRRPPKWALALGALTPLLALGALAALDLATNGDSHFSRVLSGDGADFGDTVQRRYALAWNALMRGYMPIATLAAIGLAILAWRRRADWYARMPHAYAAALLGGLAGGVIGTLTNDSGPVLLVLGTVVLAAATSYIRGNPEARSE